MSDKLGLGRFLINKLKEMEFFLNKIIDITEGKIQENTNNISAINYYFSAYLNSIQSIKDSAHECFDADISWKNLGAEYSSFLRKSRNAITHDGIPLIDSSEDNQYFIKAEYIRINNHNKEEKITSPKLPIHVFCLTCSINVLECINENFKLYGDKIQSPDIDHIREAYKQAIELNNIGKDLIGDIEKHFNEIIKPAAGNDLPNVREDLRETISNMLSTLEVNLKKYQGKC